MIFITTQFSGDKYRDKYHDKYQLIFIALIFIKTLVYCATEIERENIRLISDSKCA